jgi:acyl-CoA synthetase (AMP-forming)/AMP-acid ligase II
MVYERARCEPTKLAFRCFHGPTFSSDTLTYQSLWEKAAALAYLMQIEGLTNQRVLLICKSPLNFVVSFFACVMAGAVAVPCAPPTRQSLLQRLQLIASDTQAHGIVFDCDEVQRTDILFCPVELIKFDLRCCVINEECSSVAARWAPCPSDGSAAAFLQYTSGSTREPTGVVVSHDNLAQNCAAIQSGMAISRESSTLIALPLFHDMGLLGALQSMFSGCLCNFLSPIEFVRHPERWLQIISNFQITISGGPNFMYDLAIEAMRSKRIKGLDLSHWRVAFCGAEPVRAATISRFTQEFEAVGFRPETFYPCYGLAESTLFVTGGTVGKVPAIHKYAGAEVVGCGKCTPGTRIEIVNPDSLAALPDGCIGEIWVESGSVAKGYWMRPELTRRTFRARLCGDRTAFFLRTGDLGYVVAGELFVYGRLKDTIVVNGKKYAPQDIEAQAEGSHIGLRVGGGAAFAVSESTAERVVVVCEVKRDWLRRYEEWPTIVCAVRQSIASGYGMTVNDVVLIKPGALPRTSSGKVRRAQTRADYLNESLLTVIDVASPSESVSASRIRLS